MGSPNRIFADRAALIAWVESRVLGMNQMPPKAQMDALAEIRRTVNANGHLLLEHYL